MALDISLCDASETLRLDGTWYLAHKYRHPLNHMEKFRLKLVAGKVWSSSGNSVQCAFPDLRSLKAEIAASLSRRALLPAPLGCASFLLIVDHLWAPLSMVVVRIPPDLDSSAPLHASVCRSRPRNADRCSATALELPGL